MVYMKLPDDSITYLLFIETANYYYHHDYNQLFVI